MRPSLFVSFSNLGGYKVRSSFAICVTNFQGKILILNRESFKWSVAMSAVLSPRWQEWDVTMVENTLLKIKHTEIVILAFEYHSVFIYLSIFIFFLSSKRIQPSKFIPAALAGRCVRLLQRKGCFVCLMCCSEIVLLCARGTTDEHPSFRCVLWGTSVFRPSVSYANSTPANMWAGAALRSAVGPNVWR